MESREKKTGLGEIVFSLIVFSAMGIVGGIAIGIGQKLNAIGVNICNIAKPESKPVEGACLDNSFLTIEDFIKECAGEIRKVTLCDDKSCGVAVEWKCGK